METSDPTKTKVEAILEKVKTFDPEIGFCLSYKILSNKNNTHLIKLSNGEIELYQTDIANENNLTEKEYKRILATFRRENTGVIKIDDIVKVSPLIYAVMVFCGALYLDIYYSAFHINIFMYLGLSEIFLSFINIIIPMLGLFVLVVLEIIIIGSVIKRRGLFKYHGNKNWWQVVAVGATAGYIIFALLNDIDGNIRCYTIVFAFAIIIYVVCIGNELRIRTVHTPKFIFIYSLLALLTTVSFQATMDIKTRIQSIKYESVVIKTIDTTISTSPSYYYVGRTNEYLFLFNPIDTSRDLIPANQIKEISFHWNKPRK